MRYLCALFIVGCNVDRVWDSNGFSLEETTDCLRDEQCVAKGVTPALCAAGRCDHGRCVYTTKDEDNDGVAAKNCTSTEVAIITGGDCDDRDPKAFPGSYDGPPTSMESNRCDTVDNDCNGSPDDGKAPDGSAQSVCGCEPGKTPACYALVDGTAIDAATLGVDGEPMGTCKKGTRACEGGLFAGCAGAVGPSIEQCDDEDHDCNGVTGNDGNGGAMIADLPTWYKDGDDDGAGDPFTAPVTACAPPGAGWKVNLLANDCNDADASVKPGKAEVCDGKDNNCAGGIDEGFNVGASCSFGTGVGACENSGKVACAGGAAVCNPPAGIPTDNWMSEKAPNGSWDWDCKDGVESMLNRGADGAFNGDCSHFGIATCGYPKEHAYFALQNGEPKNCGGTHTTYRCTWSAESTCVPSSPQINNTYPILCN